MYPGGRNLAAEPGLIHIHYAKVVPLMAFAAAAVSLEG